MREAVCGGVGGGSDETLACDGGVVDCTTLELTVLVVMVALLGVAEVETAVLVADDTEAALVADDDGISEEDCCSWTSRDCGIV